jgi:hypothetical protein
MCQEGPVRPGPWYPPGAPLTSREAGLTVCKNVFSLIRTDGIATDDPTDDP